MRKYSLTNNQLKLIAMVTMTIDHIGMFFFPEQVIWRAIGRIAFPIYAFMIAEGCRHTRKPGRYLCSLAVLAAVCQIVLTAVTGEWAMNVLVTFSISALLILLLKQARREESFLTWLYFVLAIIGVVYITLILPWHWIGFSVEYGLWGILLPVAVYAAKGSRQRLLGAGACLAMISRNIWSVQWFSFLALPLLELYNGRRGTQQLKWVFYLYYPVHLGLLWLLKMAF